MSIDQPDSLRSKIRDLSRTRWVEPHEAYETFALLLPSIVKKIKSLAVIKPVIVKLQKRSNDIVKAYNMIAETEKELRQMGNNANTVFRNGIKCSTLKPFIEHPPPKKLDEFAPEDGEKVYTKGKAKEGEKLYR